MLTLNVLEKTATGAERDDFQVCLPNGEMTVRDLICRCVDFRLSAIRELPVGSQRYTCLVPNDDERLLNGDKPRKRPELDVQKHYERVFQAFDSNQIMLFVDGHQFENLDDEIVVTPDSQVTFLKLVPLVGG